MNVLPNADFGAGLEGWTVVELFAAGSSWRVESEALVIESRGAACSAAGTVQVHSPRVRASPGGWSATVEVRASDACLVDFGIVAPAVIAVPGPPMQAPPFETTAIGAGTWTKLRTSRIVAADAVSIGLRLVLPAGVDVSVRRAELDGEDAPEPSRLSLGFDEHSHAFTSGAIVTRGERRRVTVIVHNRADEEVEATLEVAVIDAYRGDRVLRRETQRCFPPGVTRLPVDLPTELCGCFALDAVITDAPEVRAQLRFIVDDDGGERRVDPGSPWGVTSGVMATEQTSAMLRLLGVAHTRLYSGFGSWDSPAVDRIADADTADALLATLRFVGAATGSRAGMAARRHASGASGVGEGGWPKFAEASGFLGDARDADLVPAGALVDGFRDVSILAETTLHLDADVWSRFVRCTAQGLRHHSMAWAAANEPDLAGHEPDVMARLQRVFTDAVRQGDDGAVVVGPMLADGWDGCHQGLTGWRYLERWAAAGGMDAVDAVSIHLHMIDEETSTPEREWLEERLGQLRAFVDRLGGEGKPIWVTEMGWRSHSTPLHGFGDSESGPRVEEWEQADLLVRAACLAVSAGVERFYAFHLHGFRPFCEGYGFEWGLVTGPAGGPKPAFFALRSLTGATHGLRPAGRATTDLRVRAVLFEGGDRAAAVVWQWSGGPGLFTLDEIPGSVSCRDLMNVPADGRDLRRPLILTWSRSAIDGVAWIESRLGARYPSPYSYVAKQKGEAR